MNKMKNLTWLMLIGLLVFTVSCDDNDDLLDDLLGDEDIKLEVTDKENVKVTAYASDYTAGSTFTALVDYTSSNDDMKRVYVTENYFGAGDKAFKLPTVSYDDKLDGSLDLAGSNSGNFSFEIPFPVYDVATTGEVVYTIWATSGRGDFRDSDKRLSVGLGTITVDYGGNNPATDVKEYSATILAAPLADGSSSTFISLLDGEIYKINEGEEFAAFWDFGYYYGNTNLASLASAYDYPTSIIDIPTVANTTLDELNHTYFATSTVAFDNVTKSSDLSSISASSSEAINQLEIGDEIEFVDNYGKKGVIKVADLVTGNGSNGKITLDIKVQP